MQVFSDDAKWIKRDVQPSREGNGEAAPYFRKEFCLAEEPVSATAYICGLGFYELRLNGQKAGDQVLAPLFTQYDKTVAYDVIDVTALLQKGDNAVGVLLGNGWYNECFGNAWNFQDASWRDVPKLLLQIDIYYNEGRTQRIISDPSFLTSEGPVGFNQLRIGEYYDATKEQHGWDSPGFDDSRWVPARLAAAPGGTLKTFDMPPIRVTKVLKPLACVQIGDSWVTDFGQNISGWVRLSDAAPAGTTVQFRYSEKIYPDGSIDQDNINVHHETGGLPFHTDRYTFKGEGIETWEPRFTYHGFRYVETNRKVYLEACVVHTDLNQIGSFACDNPLLNKIYESALWSTLTNYHGIPTDCPHREKNGWTGDTLLSAEQILLNFDVSSSYEKWLSDFQDAQRPSGQLPGIIPTGGWGFNWGSGPAWDSAIVLLPWYIYLYTGNEDILEKFYNTMTSYVDYMATRAEGYIAEFGLGDWCPPATGKDYPVCPVAVTDTAYYYVDCLTLSKIADILGDQKNAAWYAGEAGKIKQAFVETFINPDTGVVANGVQTAQACALYQGLVPEELQEKVFARLVDAVEAKGRHHDCGILGIKYLLTALSEFGRHDLAYAIATQTDFPSWGLWIEQGATTLWEQWNGEASQNHHMFSSICDWFYKFVAGIQPDEASPGFSHILFRPHIAGGLTGARASHESCYGKATIEWAIKDETCNITVEVPAGCSATLIPPRECGGKEILLSEGLHSMVFDILCSK